MENFEIETQKTNEQIDYIVCQPKRLRIKVIPPGKQPKEYLPGQMIITASVKLDGKSVDYDFQIIEPNDGDINKDWSMDLFYDAIEYYCQNIFDQETAGFSVANNPKFYPYGGM